MFYMKNIAMEIHKLWAIKILFLKSERNYLIQNLVEVPLGSIRENK